LDAGSRPSGRRSPPAYARRSGLTELAIRLHDDPMEGLKLIGERVVPALR